MKNPYLIQRLQKPIQKEFENPFNFGGGYIHGGFDNNSWVIISRIMRFDYMGSAEFEFGELPRSFKRIFEHRKSHNLLAGKLNINGKLIYVITPKEIEQEVVEYLRLLATKGDFCRGRKKSIYLKEPTHLKQILEQKKINYTHDPIGWIDIENDFMFFLDENMFDDTLKLLGLEKFELNEKRSETKDGKEDN